MPDNDEPESHTLHHGWAVGPEEFGFVFASEKGVTYALERTYSLGVPNWIRLRTFTGNGVEQQWTDLMSRAGFYRVRELGKVP